MLPVPKHQPARGPDQNPRTPVRYSPPGNPSSGRHNIRLRGESFSGWFQIAAAQRGSSVLGMRRKPHAVQAVRVTENRSARADAREEVSCELVDRRDHHREI